MSFFFCPHTMVCGFFLFVEKQEAIGCGLVMLVDLSS